MATPGSALYPGPLTFPGIDIPVLCQRIDSGSMAPVLIDPALISTRYENGPLPSWMPCLQVMADAENPGGYILVGALNAIPVFYSAPRP